MVALCFQRALNVYKVIVMKESENGCQQTKDGNCCSSPVEDPSRESRMDTMDLIGMQGRWYFPGKLLHANEQCDIISARSNVKIYTSGMNFVISQCCERAHKSMVSKKIHNNCILYLP